MGTCGPHLVGISSKVTSQKMAKSAFDSSRHQQNQIKQADSQVQSFTATRMACCDQVDALPAGVASRTTDDCCCATLTRTRLQVYRFCGRAVRVLAGDQQSVWSGSSQEVRTAPTSTFPAGAVLSRRFSCGQDCDCVCECHGPPDCDCGAILTRWKSTRGRAGPEFAPQISLGGGGRYPRGTRGITGHAG